MDLHVLQTQIWVNNTYTGVSGYTPVTEDGLTGISTFKGLIRALQIELGIAVDGEFGNGTLNACPATISEVPDVNTAFPSNLTYIIQGAFWCKGYNPGGLNGIFGPVTSNADKAFEGDAGITQDGIIRPYILQAIMNTDGYALAPSGDVNIRAVQTGLNSRYGATFGLSPSNGIWERNSHKNLIKALQTECGVAVDGSFGSGTLGACPTLSVNTSGYTNTKRILQWALCVNGYYPGGFTGTFGTGTYNAVVSFQTFYSLTADGVVGKNFWGALMTSCGDTSRKATACDCATILTAEKAAALKSNGYFVVGRYLTGTVNGKSKALTASEIQIIFNAGLRFFPIYQSGGASNSYFNSARGTSDARAAITAAENLGIPSGSIIYFAIDYDALDVQVTSNVLPYFQSISSYFSNYGTTAYRIGVYGSRNTCTRVCNSGYAVSSFVGDMSSGYSGNLGYRLPTNWAFDQFYTVTVGSGSGRIEIDKDSYSGRYTGVDHIDKSVTRPSQDISVYQPAEAISADPVDTSTGSHTIHMEVLKVKGAIDLSFELNYNSSQLSLGTMGKGWNHNFEIKLDLVYNDIYVYWTASIYSVFTKNSEGIYITSDLGKQNDILTVNTDGTYTLNRNNDRIYTFTSLGKLTSVSDRTGKSITVTTDSSGNMVLMEPVSGRTLIIGYHVAGFVSSVTDNMGRTAAFAYDANACLTTFTDANGKTTTYTYDSKGRVLTGADGDGVTFFTDTYDASGRILTQVDALQGVTTFSSDNTSISNRLVVTITNRNGDTRTNIFDSTTIQLLSAADENGNTKSYTYDSNGNIASTTDELGNTETTTYNTRNQPLVFTSRGGSVASRTYDTGGNLLSVINPDGGTITNTYDGENRLQSTVDLRGNTTSYTYNSYGMLEKKTVGTREYGFIYENGLIKFLTDPKNGVTAYTYNAAGYPLTITDANGKTTVYTYDGTGEVLSRTDALGNVTSYTYDSRRHILMQTDPNGNVTSYSYNGNGKTSTVTDPKGNITTYTYDSEDRLIQVTDADGKTTGFVYDPAGRTLVTTDALGNITSYTYDAAGNVLTVTKLRGGVTANTYYANGKLKTQEDAAGNITTYGHDTSWRVNSITDATGNITNYTFNYAGDLLSVTDPLNNVTAYTYDEYGNLLTDMNPLGNATVYTYDENNNRMSRKDALNQITTYAYDPLGRLLTATDPLGHITVYTYDANGKLLTTTDALGNVTAVSYDGNGNITAATDALGNSNLFVYDAGNLQISSENALGNQTVNTFDALGRLIQTADPLGNVIAYTYDADGRIVSATDALNGISEQSYDADGNLLFVTNPLGGSTAYTYDTSGRKTTETTPTVGTLTYGYNSRNLLAAFTNARNQERAYTYDNARRILSFTDAEGTTSFTYDANGNVLTATDAEGTVTREFDALNRIKKVIDINGNVIQYTYDLAGNLTVIIYPDGKTVTYSYDVANRLSTVTDWSGRITSYSYDANGRLLSVSRPDGSILTQSWDAAGRMATLSDRDVNGDVIAEYSYSYDVDGRMVTETSSHDSYTSSMTYDALGRLIGKNDVDSLTGTPLTSYTYSYDSNGNILSGNSSGQTAAMTYNNQDCLNTYNGQAAVFDPDGNMTSCMLGGSAVAFTFDSGNRLISAGNANYTYDAFGNRITSAISGQNRTYVFDNVSSVLSRLLVSTDSGGITYYVYGLDLIGHQDVNGYSVYHYDYRGSTVAMSDSNGTVTDRYNYGTYGELLSHAGTSSTPFLYNGRDGVMTEENGLYYMRTRYYSPELKRFVNADSKKGTICNSQTLNLYAYATGNPITLVDPSGMSSEPGNSSSSAITIAHTVLDFAGMIPVFGAVFDLANGIWYATEGNYIDMGYSLAGVIPVIGDFAQGGKLGYKAVKLTGEIVDVAGDASKAGKSLKIVLKSTDEVVSNKSIVIGEGMQNIKTVAKQLQAEGVDAKWYQAWSKNFPNNRPMTPDELSAALARNQRWIDSKIKQGYDIYDIGTDPLRITRSPFYELEQSRVNKFGYPIIDITGRRP